MHINKYPHFIVNVIGLKIGWLSCVLGGANAMPWLGVVVVSVIVGIHLFFSDDRAAEATLIGIVAAIGLVWDSALTSAGLMVYPSGSILPGLAPYWIVAMWVLFATALNVALAWLKGRPFVAAMFGGIGGVMAFYGGYKLGGVDIPNLPLGLAAQGVGWAIIMPLLAWLATRFNGVALTAARPRELSGSNA